MLIDSHCHLDFDDFAAELDDIVARAEAAGVERLITICTRPDELAQNLALTQRYERVYLGAGVHPHEAAHFQHLTVDDLAALADHPKLVGLGETGLDYYYDNSPRAAQQALFRAHCQAARRTGLPMIVHTRDADADTIRIIAEEGLGEGEGPLRGLIHCFSSGRELAEKAVELGFYVSLSGILTFKRSEEIRAIVRDLPMDRLMVETDAPFLAPVPKRGKRNEPAFVAHTAAVLAEVKGVSQAEIERITTQNVLRLFDRMPAPVGLAA